MASKRKMKRLISLIENWNYNYYFLDQSIVEDSIYDKHLRELKDLEIKHNLILPDSPTQKAGHSASNKFRPIVRQKPMLSLDSVDNYEDLLKFDERVKKILKKEEEIEYICEWKIDGLSIGLVYQNHQLIQVSTRGNGNIGEDVTFNKELIKNIPFFLSTIANCEIRGEIYMKKSEFFRLNKELEKNDSKLLANPRNAASGSLRTLVPLQNRKLHFFAYQLFNSSLDSQSTCLRELEKLGFAVSPDYQLCKGIEKTKEFIQKHEPKRLNLDFESDGIVVKVNNYDFYPLLGQTSRFPRWAIAYKFLALSTTSQIEKIYVEVSRNGRITYVAEIKPVTLQGSIISKVTLHNYSFIRNLKLNIGDKVLIKKAGDVIPQIIQLIKLTENIWLPPNACPSCNSTLKWNPTNIYQICDNNYCSQRTINLLAHFASKSGLDIKGLSQKNIEKLYQNNLIKKPIDFYQLEQKREELLKLEGFQKKSIDNILSSIKNSKKKPLTNLLIALGIPLLSSVKAKKLSIFYPNLASIRTIIENNEWEKIRELLGEETQKEMKNYFQNPENFQLLKELEKIWGN
ncbi:NAD-dependent DNA ligase LigA [endosymbiont GvMRE of Glomus versiforme]|uniref:NAD-dependent DNA ligase LigA n=1 Tax=endosymbiont GvMRE of Glomus versiforme TaxID=2039283 RepID=UPI0015599B53|nr:NAD-dependent DNA ligase LigA [endosymbiont GvMRE of Glomus versiforme]